MAPELSGVDSWLLGVLLGQGSVREPRCTPAPEVRSRWRQV